MAGSGRKRRSDEEVDFLLTIEPSKYRVGGRHFRLFQRPDNGVLMALAGRHEIILDDTEPLRNTERVLYEGIGILVRVIETSIFPEAF